jgi:hypothetical protein
VVKMSVTTDEGEQAVTGVLLAQASSRQFKHRQHPGMNHAPPKQRCSACRWTRVTLLRMDDPSDPRPYAIVTEGFSLVPGERVLGNVERTSSPLWVIEYLHRTNKDRERYLPLVARNALMMAVQYDEKLARECEHRGIDVGPVT